MNELNKAKDWKDKRSGKDRRVADDNIMYGTDMRTGKDRREMKSEKLELKPDRND